MGIQQVTRLVVSSEAAAECEYRESALRVEDNQVFFENAGFLVMPEEPGPGRPVLAARRFAVGSSERTGFEAEEIDELVDDVEHYGIPAEDLRFCGRRSRVRFALQLDNLLCEARVTMRILLAPRTGVTVSDEKRSAWADAIVNAWSSQCKLVRISGLAPCAEYTVIVEVLWTQNPNDRHRWVDVAKDSSRGASGRAHTGLWYLGDPAIVAAHEFGHYLGNIDEYNGACDGCPGRPVYAHSIMSDERAYPHPWPRHYWLIAEQVGRLTCSQFEPVLIEDRAGARGGSVRAAEEFVVDIACTIGRFFYRWRP